MEREILSTYQHIATVTGEMLSAARKADWDRLIELERDCTALFTRLVALDSNATAGDAQFQKLKATLIREVLDHDAEIRAIVEPWLTELSVLLGISQREKKINRAYGID